MHISIDGRHVDVTDGLRTHVTTGLTKLKFAEPVLTAHVVLSVDKHHHGCEVVLNGRDLTIKVQEESSDMYGSIDAALKKADVQLKKHHEQFKKLRTLDKREKQREEDQQFQL